MDPNSQPSDAQLLALITRGEPAAFDLLYARHRQWVYRLAFRFTGNDADAWDVHQETFLYLANRARTLKLTATLRTLLFTVIRSSAIKANQKRRRLVLDEQLLAALPESSPQRDDADLRTALETLDLPHRQVVILRYIDDLSIDEIADVMAIPPGTVKSRLFHAHQLLRDNPRIRRYFGV